MGRQIIAFLEKNINALINNAEIVSDSIKNKETGNTENDSKPQKSDMRHVARNTGGEEFLLARKTLRCAET